MAVTFDPLYWLLCGMHVPSDYYSHHEENDDEVSPTRRVVSLGFDGGNDAVITPDGLDAMPHWQVYGGYSFYWLDSFNSTVSAAWAELDNSEFQLDDTIHRAGSVHASLLWFPYKRASMGIEGMWGRRENKDGASGSAWRLQSMLKHQFN